MFEEGAVLRDAAIAFTVVSPLFVAIRFACRLANRGLGWDDWTLVPGLIFGLVMNALSVVAVAHGLGQDQKNLSYDEERLVFVTVWLAHVLYKLGVSFIKSSICLLYLRIFTDKLFRILTWTTLALTAVFGIIISLATIFQCRPITATWDPNERSKEATWCASTEALWYSSGTFFIITDLVLVILPIPLIWKIQRPLKEKLLLYVIFGIGLFVTATSIVKMTSVDIQATKKNVTLFLGAALWSMIELHVGIICACLPTLRASISRILPTIVSRRSSAYSGSGGGEYGKRKWSSPKHSGHSDVDCGEVAMEKSITKRTDISTKIEEEEASIINERPKYVPEFLEA